VLVVLVDVEEVLMVGVAVGVNVELVMVWVVVVLMVEIVVVGVVPLEDVDVAGVTIVVVLYVGVGTVVVLDVQSTSSSLHSSRTGSKFRFEGHIIFIGTELWHLQYEWQSHVQGKAPLGLGQVKESADGAADKKIPTAKSKLKAHMLCS